MNFHLFHIIARKHAPFSIKESGYASFNPKIDIYFKCGPRDESKVFNVPYDLDIAKSSVQKFSYTIVNPSTEFRQRLMEGGGVQVTNDGKLFTINLVILKKKNH